MTPYISLKTIFNIKNLSIKGIIQQGNTKT